MDRNNVEEVYQDFWKEIIADEDGNIDFDQLKKELCDYYNMLQEVPKVYCEVTGGLLSKPLYNAQTVIDCFYDRYGNKAAWVDLLTDYWQDITADCYTNEDYKKAVFEYFDIVED